MRTYHGSYADNLIDFVANGIMSDGSLTYIRKDCENGCEPDGKIRQYQRNKHNEFFLITED